MPTIDPLNPGWSIGEAIVSRLEALFESEAERFGEYTPEIVVFVPPGVENVRPAEASRAWVTVSLPTDPAVLWETSDSYIVKPTYTIRINVEEPDRLPALPEKLLELTHFVRLALTPDTLGGMVRRNPRETGSATYAVKASTITVVSEMKLEYEYQGHAYDFSLPSLLLGSPFPEVYQGADAPTVTILISNPGTATLTISSVSTPTGFTASSVPASVAAGGTDTFTLTLDSTATIGDFSGTVIVHSNAGDVSTAVTASVIADPRLTRIPVLCVPGLAMSIDARPNTIFQWQIPDGSGGWTYQRANRPTFTAAKGTPGEYIYLLMDDGHTVAELTQLDTYYSGFTVPNHVIETEDLQYIALPGNLSLVHSILQGDIKYLSGCMQKSVYAQYFFGNTAFNYSGLYGDVGNWAPIEAATDVRFRQMDYIHGVLKFATGCPLATLFHQDCRGFSAVEISQTIINWNACNAGVFARTGNFNQVKRSELTAEGEAAVVSLLAKGCAFTFQAE